MRRLAGLGLMAWFAGVLAAQQLPPREIWPQSTSAAREADVEMARKKTIELIDTGKAYGLKTYPSYAVSAASLARQAEGQGDKAVGDWATSAANQLDPKSPGVAFSNTDRAADRKDWAAALPKLMRGMLGLLTNYRTSLLSRADLFIVLVAAIALTAALFAVSLFMRYGRSLAHDFREMLARRFRGGSVSVLAFALLFLPIFLWLGPMWLIFYWLVIFFSYAGAAERTCIIILALLLALSPIILDLTAYWTAGVDSPVVVAAVASTEQAYHPEALRRLQELVALVPDNPTLHMLLGNLQMHEGNEQQAGEHYRRSLELRESAGGHVNIGNLHFLNNDFPAAITQYQTAQKLDPQLAIAFYNNSVAAGETYRFDEQAKFLDAAKRVSQTYIERLAQSPPAQKIVVYHPSIAEAWEVAAAIARRGVARSLFGNYAYFDLRTSALNPVTLGALATILFSALLWMRRRRTGVAGSCIKCGRTFCHRCKSSRESATYCTQCIHIYLKRDGVSLDTKRSKLEEVTDYQTGLQRRNRFFATILPGSAQILEGRTVKGILGAFLFLLFVVVAVTSGRLAPVLAPVAVTAQMAVRIAAIALAVIIWFLLSLPVYRRRMTTT